MKHPLVTISIPTYNSAGTLGECLAAIAKQTYSNIEINIVDKNSEDETIKIAKKYHVKIRKVKGSLLQARYEGAKYAKGKYILLLDSDQIIGKRAIEQAIAMVERKKLGMLVFEETVYRKENILEYLFFLDRKLINTVSDLSPFTGVIMPRFFSKTLLMKAYNAIPREIFPNTGGPDHAIVYYEAWKKSKRVGVLPNSVKHIEPRDLYKMSKKFFRWGYTSIDAHFGKYEELMSQKERFRTGLFTKGLVAESMGSITLLLIKGVPFKLGYLVGKIDRKMGLSRRY